MLSNIYTAYAFICVTSSSNDLLCIGSIPGFGSLGNVAASRGNSLCPIDTKSYRVVSAALEPSVNYASQPTFTCALLDNGVVKCWYLPVTDVMGADLASYSIDGEFITSVCIQSDLASSNTRTVYVLTNASQIYSFGKLRL
jgi:hypothetical protein